MRHFKTLIVAGIAALSLISFPTQAATVLFQDNFNTDSAGSVLNFNALNNWTVSNGSIDYIRNGGFGISCAGATFRATSAAALRTSSNLVFWRLLPVPLRPSTPILLSQRTHGNSREFR